MQTNFCSTNIKENKESSNLDSCMKIKEHLRKYIDSNTQLDKVLKIVYSALNKKQKTSVLTDEKIIQIIEKTLMALGMLKTLESYIKIEGMNHIRLIFDSLDQHTQKLVVKVKIIILEYGQDLNEIDSSKVIDQMKYNFYEGLEKKDLYNLLIITVKSLIEIDPEYSKLCARILLVKLYQEAFDFLGVKTSINFNNYQFLYKDYLVCYFRYGIENGILHPDFSSFNIEKIISMVESKKDLNFHYLGLQTIYDRYLLHKDGIRFELPQALFIRVAMGLSIEEKNKEEQTKNFYQVLSSFDFMCSTPTLFNSGTKKPQLSSCYLTSVNDSLVDIYDSIKDNALLSKYAGGLGNDWTPVRANNAHIKGTNGISLGVIPFLNVVNSTALAVNQGGKRKGAVCSYLETWHLDIEDFLELRKNTGDERRRTHDMNTANWIPDLFMQRVLQDDNWTLFSPEEVPDLHSIFGKPFKKRYEYYEGKAKEGLIKNFRKVKAVALWRKILSMLFETGHPWITFKDPCNLRSPQQHLGVVNSSNLCTEITLNTSKNEIAVCNLGSVNLVNHIDFAKKSLDLKKLEYTIKLAIRMLDNVIDINYYPVKKAKLSNFDHRPIGLGVMGLQDTLNLLGISFASQEAVNFSDYFMENISYISIKASCELAAEKGSYKTFKGSLWSKGILPIDSIKILKDSRYGNLDMDSSHTLKWSELRDQITKNGIRNSNILAIAPTATIANICNVSQSIEPLYQNLYVKSNLSGEFIIINSYLISKLKKLGIWNDRIRREIKKGNGSIQSIKDIPQNMKKQFLTAFEISPKWLIEAASRRQKWLDQSQSLNLYLSDPSGRKIDTMYKMAWIKGLKTTYYLRSLGKSHVEKTTVEDSILNAVPSIGKEEEECYSCQ